MNTIRKQRAGQRYRGNVIRALMVSAGMVLMVISDGALGANSVNLTFKYTVVQGTCDVSSSDPKLDLGNVDPTPAFGSGSWVQLGKKAFTVNLNNCTGSADSQTRPVVMVTGETAPGTDSGYNFLFRKSGTAGGTSKGFGVLIVKTDMAEGESGTDIEVKNGTAIYVPKTPGGTTYFGKGEALNGSFAIPLFAAVSCGRKVADMCNPANLLAGTLSASVTFTFQYK